MKPLSARRARTVPAIFALLACACLSASATDYTWDGGGGDDLWGTGANWVGDTAPSPGSGNSLIFAGTTRLTPSNNYGDGDDFQNITFDSTAGSFTLGRSGTQGIDWFGSITNNSANAQTIGFNFYQSAANTINAASGDITLNSSALVSRNGQGLTLNAASGKTIKLSGVIANGSGAGSGIAVTGAGTVNFDAANTFTSGIGIDSGTVLATTSASALGTGTVWIGNGGSTYGNTSAALAIGTSGLTITNAITTNMADNAGSQGTGTRTIATTYSSGTTTLSTGAININGGLVFDTASGGTLAVSSTIQNGGDTGVVLRTLTKTGAGMLTLSGGNTYSGGTTIDAGTLSINAANRVGTGGITINASGTLATTAAMTITTNISGTGAMAHSSGNLVLQGTNTFSGTTTVTGGYVVFDSINAENGAPALALNGGNLGLGTMFVGTTATIGSLSGNSTSSSINPNYGATTGVRTLSVNQTVDGTYLGKIEEGTTSRSMAVVKEGSAKLTLSGINTYTGGTTVNAGTLRLTASSGGTGTIRGTVMANAGTTIEIGGIDVLGYSTGSDAVRTINLNGATLVQTQNRNETNTAVINMAGGSTISATGGSSALFDLFGGSAAINASGDLTNTISSPLRLRQDSSTFTVADGAAATDLLISGVISANATSENYLGAIIKAGAGTMVLSGGNTFPGTVTVNAGTIKVGDDTALGAANTAVTKVVVNSGGTIDFNGVPDATYGYTIAGTGAAGTGALVNSGAEIGTGKKQATNIKLSADASIGGTGNWALLANGYGATSLDLNGKTLTKVGANTIYLCNTTISNGGTIRVLQGMLGTANNGSVGSSTALILDNTVGVGLNLGANLVIGSLSGGGAAGGNVTSSATLTVGGLDTSTTYAGVISGTGALTKTGTGTLALTGANTYGGNTTINGGTLDLTAGRLYSAGYQSTAIVTVAGGTLLLNSFAYDLAAASLGGLRDYASARVINGGTIEVVGGTHSSGNDFTVGTNGGTFRYNPANTANTLTLSGNGNSNIPIAGALTFQADGNITVSEVIEGAGSLTKTGVGTLTLSNAGNSFTGDVTINAGQVTAIGASGNTNTALGLASGSRTITVNSTGTLMLSGNNVFGGSTQTLANTPKVVVAGGTLTTNAYNVIGNIDLNGGTLTATAGGSAGYQTYEFNGSTITVGGTSASTISSSAASYGGMHIAGTKTLTLNVGDVVSGTDLTVSAALIDGSSDRLGAGSLLKSGTGTLLLSGINTYTGGTTVNGGTLRLTASSGGTGTIRGTLTANAGTTIEIGGSDVLGYGGGANAVNTINLDGATLVQTQNRNETSTAVINMAGGSTISATGGASALFDMYGGTAAINSSGDLTNTISSPIRFRQDSTTFTVADGAAATDLLVSGSISENELAEYRHTALVKDGAGTMVLSGAGSYTGNTTIKAGTLALSGSGSIATSAVITVGDAGSSGTVLDVSGLTSGTNTGDWTLASGQTLMGIGDVTTASTGTITIAGTHAPGNSAGIQQINGSTTYASGSIFEWELYADTTSNSPTVSYDQVNVNGTLKIEDGALFNVVLNDTGSTVNLADTFWQQAQQWQVFSSTGNLTYTNGFILNAVSSAQAPVSSYGSFTFTYGTGTVHLNWTPVPELSNLLVGGLLAVGLLRRKRQDG